ncbi:Acetyltransferase [Aureococcus anophagefferens]|nr:Acetyltransferase [Aureococcus anophagefferens]
MGAAITTATLVIGLSASCGAFSSTAQPRPPTALRAKKADPSRRHGPCSRTAALLSVGGGARRGHGGGDVPQVRRARDFRRRGVGGTLLAACEAAAADRGAAAIACDARREQAIAFWLAL